MFFFRPLMHGESQAELLHEVPDDYHSRLEARDARKSFKTRHMPAQGDLFGNSCQRGSEAAGKMGRREEKMERGHLSS